MRAGLARAGSVAAAAEQLMEVMVAAGFELPSIYLERGGRLRCTAQRGYWQVYDGLAPGAGVLGSTFAAGATQVVRDLGDTPESSGRFPTWRPRSACRCGSAAGSRAP